MKTFIPAIIWSIIILWLSVMPGKNLPQSIWDLIALDKLAHAFVYCVLSVLLIWGFSRIGKISSKFLFLSVLISSAYGVLMEIIQFSFFPDRYFELYDIVANIIGALCSLIIIRFFIK